MKQEEVIQLMRKVIKESEYYTTWTVSTPHLVELVKRAVEAEREACAKVCDAFQARDVGMQPAECAGAIRARGQA
jgi:predicted choloylglycine hydrolase